jgi:hypothetical protein
MIIQVKSVAILLQPAMWCTELWPVLSDSKWHAPYSNGERVTTKEIHNVLINCTSYLIDNPNANKYKLNVTAVLWE